MAPKPWILVSPASRGIGFALARRVLQTTKAPVVATARSDLDGVKERLIQDLPQNQDISKRLQVVRADVTDELTMESAAKTCANRFPPEEGHQLHLALTIPGILRAEKSPAQIKADDALDSFRINVIGPMLLMKHFHGFLPRKKAHSDAEHEVEASRDMPIWEGLPPYAVWAAMSARVGSISDNRTVGGWYSYRSSKAAVNQLVRSFDLYLRTRAGNGAVCFGMHPGTVKTDLSRDYWSSTEPEKLFSPDFSAERLVDLCCGRLGVGVEGRGKCWDWDGKEIAP